MNESSAIKKQNIKKNGYYIRFNKPTVKGLTILNGVNDNGILESNVQKAAILMVIFFKKSLIKSIRI